MLNPSYLIKSRHDVYYFRYPLPIKACMHHDKNCTHEHKGFLACVLSWKGVALILALAGISYYLLTVHLEHAAVALPYLFLLACPLMHIFGHGHGHQHAESEKDKPKGD